MKKKKTRRVTKSVHASSVATKLQADVISSNQSSSKVTSSIGRKIFTWFGWAIVYVLVFYLGNLSGEYVAAHMPILPSLPRISVDTNKFKKLIPHVSLPKVSVAWKWPVKTSVPVQVESHTTLVVVRGNFINMPTAGATEAEKKAFVDSVTPLVVESSKITVNDSCELTPAFIHAKQGASIEAVNTSTKDHTLLFDGKSTAIASNKKATVSLTQGEGAYPISCDGVVAGFYRVN